MQTLLSSLEHLPNVPDVERLLQSLYILYGRAMHGNNSGQNEEGLAGRLRAQIQNQVRDKMNSLKKNNDDPFLVSSNIYHSPAAAATRIAARRRAATARREREAQEASAAREAAAAAQAARDAADLEAFRREIADTAGREQRQRERINQLIEDDREAEQETLEVIRQERRGLGADR